MPGEDNGVELEVVPDLEEASSSRTGFRTFRAVSRSIPGRSASQGLRRDPRWDAGRPSAHIGRAVDPSKTTARRCRHASRQASQGARAGRSGAERFNSSTRAWSSSSDCDGRVILADGLGGRRVLQHQRSEAQAREQLEATIAGRASIAKRLWIEGYGNVSADPRQLAALPGILGVVQQAFPVALVADFCGMLQQRIDRPVGRNQIARALLADARNALDVVDRVAHQREYVHDLRRRDAKLLFHARRVVPRAILFRVVDRNPVVHQLEEILVSGDDGDVESSLDGLFGERTDHVVRLEALGRQNRHAQGFTGFVDPRNLLGQIRRHRRAVRLVVGGQL